MKNEVEVSQLSSSGKAMTGESGNRRNVVGLQLSSSGMPGMQESGSRRNAVGLQLSSSGKPVTQESGSMVEIERFVENLEVVIPEEP
ncbi:uncharacterized protein LOC116308399 isoform X2 [Actinia tenebrosa]|uniref:Uncharacterized protein LOC116308399 isoform X2 n=1 Tax=Actinia tenebrosa TaxID=6105 RepID=A0A6P8J4W6_ACTTE|nr:uncharacterized protein LOC116308399 isoform X2 [Actinia tenebrosa]